ncbi:aldo/keto reductase [Mollicutes bacterium LVI A0078]|nr:aldo/keto reductase [Mollicutes bacterium LVI A0075]WOO91632.1 aldo/keto reductase [Mollicutes bacterium LVI A0078]
MGRLAFGVWRINDITSDDVYNMLVELKKLGINVIDTADIYHLEQYGDSERLIGDALAKDEELRKYFKVVTKCGIKAGAASPELPHYDFSYDHIIKSAIASKDNLGVESIDILLLHRPDLFADFGEIADAFEYLRNEGIVKHFGVSNFTPTQFESLNRYLLKRKIRLITNQIEMNTFTTEHIDNDNIFYLKGAEVNPMIWSPLAGGRLFTEGNDVNGVLTELAEKYNTTIGNIAIAFLNNQGLDPIIILGSMKIERYKEALEGMEIKLERIDMYKIMKALTGKDVK